MGMFLKGYEVEKNAVRNLNIYLGKRLHIE